MSHGDDSAPRSFIVFGGSGTIGSRVAGRLAAAGANVTIAARDSERLALAASETGATPRTCDARDSSAVDALVASVVDAGGRLDGVVSCIGSLSLSPAHLVTDEVWGDTVRTNLDSSFFILRAAVRAMMKSGGSIVLTSSAAASIGLANHEAIGAAKCGVEGLVRSAAASYGPRGVRVNAVAPGLVDSELTSRIVQDERSLETSRRMHVLGRIGNGDDVASAITWLLDAENSWVTGAVIPVDGGLGSVRSRS